MKILIARVIFIIPQSYSLKDKRRIIRAIKDKIWLKFRVSIAEIEDHDNVQKAVLGIVYVSNDKQLLDGIINKVINLIEGSFPGLLHDFEYTLQDY
jgi:uncharacterized protein YlxP (DUF503 family)